MTRLLPAVIVATMVTYGGCGGDKGTPTSPGTPSPGTPANPNGVQVDPLRDAARGAGKLVGAAVQSGFLADGRYSSVLNRHFNYLTAEYEMKWDPIERTRGNEDFSGGDAIVSYAQANGMQVKGHALVWHGSVPSWVNSLSAADLRVAFESHIRSVAQHFRGRVYAWDVVNEAVADDGSGLRDTVFRQKLGDQYIADAFRIARQADPQALLDYNDYGGEGLSQKSNRIYDLVQTLRSQGVPIDGVGLQMHITASNPPSDASIASNMRRLATLFVGEHQRDGCPDSRPAGADKAGDAEVGLSHGRRRLRRGTRCDGTAFWVLPTRIPGSMRSSARTILSCSTTNALNPGLRRARCARAAMMAV